MNPATQAKIFIQFKDNKGRKRCLSVKACHELTGKSIALIRRDDRLRKNGLDITTRMVAGLDKRVVTKVERDRQKMKATILDFLNKRLVAI